MDKTYLVTCDMEQTLKLLIVAAACGYRTCGNPPDEGDSLFFDMEGKLFGSHRSAREDAVVNATRIDYEGMLMVLGEQRKARNSKAREELNEKNLHEPNVEIEFMDYTGERGIYSLCVPCARKALQGDDEALQTIFGDDRTKRMMLAQFLIANGFSPVTPVEREVGIPPELETPYTKQ